MNVVRYNRGIAAARMPGAVLYHSGLSDDVAAVARDVIARDRISQLALVGFLWVQLVLKLRESGERRASAVSAVAACCPAMDLGASADAAACADNKPPPPETARPLRSPLSRKLSTVATHRKSHQCRCEFRSRASLRATACHVVDSPSDTAPAPGHPCRRNSADCNGPRSCRRECPSPSRPAHTATRSIPQPITMTMSALRGSVCSGNASTFDARRHLDIVPPAPAR